jgi:hypothetical protein
VETVQLPGRDQQLGAGGDDVTVTLSGFTREIVLTDVKTDLRKITVTITARRARRRVPTR